jgi:cytochrome c-type biogenesis protein CcmH
MRSWMLATGHVLGIAAVVAACLGAALAPTAGRAAEAQPTAADPALEARVNRLAAELRCLVCQNQSLADSHAPLAVDLKNQVRDQLRAGRGEQDVIDYMTARYGDFVLYRPPVKATTALLWAGPALLMAAAVGGLAWVLRRQRRAAANPAVSDEDALRAAALLAEDRT